MQDHPLKTFREREGLTQDQLAKLVGVTRETVTRWENRTRQPDEDKLPRIAKKTGIQPSVLRPDLAKRAAMFAGAAE
jgi:transcriptional regulator with XRE-family HTH domain